MTNHLAYDNLTKQRELAAETIGNSVYLYEAVTKYADIFRYDNLHSSFVNNLKDAVIHFQKMDSAYSDIDKDSTEIEDSNLTAFIQFELLSEHVTRGVVDVYVEMLQHAAMFYEMFLNCLLLEAERGTISRANEFIKKIRSSMHFCKDSVLGLRKDKMELVRIASSQPVGLNAALIVRLNIIRTTISQNYKDIQNHFHDNAILSVYDFVMNAREQNCSLYRIKDGDTIEEVAKKIGCDITHICVSNKLKEGGYKAFPKGTTWIYY